jgi:PEP-CTERM motif
MTYYNDFVNVQAGGATYNGSVVSWVAIGSTSTVNAIDNVGQSMDPVYLADGTLVTTSTTGSGLWSGNLLHAVDQDLRGTIYPNAAVLTGTNANGDSAIPYQLDPVVYPYGTLIGNTDSSGAAWINDNTIVTNQPQPGAGAMYGISQVLFASNSVPEPSTLIMAGTAISVGLAYGRSRRRLDRRRGLRPAANTMQPE